MAGRKQVPLIAVTMGDPAGIGPEIISHLFSTFTPASSIAVVLGSRPALAPWADTFGWTIVDAEDEAHLQAIKAKRKRGVCLFSTGCEDAFSLGRHSPEGGRHAGVAVELACRLADRKLVDGIVTAPISKKSLELAGYSFPGHTEMLANHFLVHSVEMMMVYKKLRIVPLTRHLPVREVGLFVTPEIIVTCLNNVSYALKTLFGLERPTIGVAALNPHSGDEGVIGREEIEIIRPAIEKVTKSGVLIDGPIPGDVLFQYVHENRYDAYVAMYHDQGLIPFKMVAKGRGVNLTIGLPVVRTSVDHGVAFDIAGEGKAEISSLKSAYQLAEKLTHERLKITPEDQEF